MGRLETSEKGVNLGVSKIRSVTKESLRKYGSSPGSGLNWQVSRGHVEGLGAHRVVIVVTVKEVRDSNNELILSVPIEVRNGGGAKNVGIQKNKPLLVLVCMIQETIFIPPGVIIHPIHVVCMPPNPIIIECSMEPAAIPPKPEPSQSKSKYPFSKTKGDVYTSAHQLEKL